MVFNRLFTRRIIAVFFLFSVLPFLYTQEGNYFYDSSGVSPHFIQRLSWTGDEYALSYEVVIEKKDSNGEYTESLYEKTEERSISVSLSAGYYRYCVIPINLLGKPDESSEWKIFEVKAAYMPSIVKFNPVVFYLDRYGIKEMEIIGDNLLEESEIYLQKTTGLSIYPINKTVISKERVKLTFDDLKLVSGVYEIYIKNPGGLETSTDGFSIQYRKPLDLFLKISWLPAIPAYGQIKDAYGSKMHMAGAGLSFEAISSGRSSFNGGLELSVSVLAINPSFDFKNGANNFFKGLYDAKNGASCAEFDLNFLFQKQFMLKRMSVTLRLGVGGTLINSSELDTTGGFLMHFNFGLSYLYFLYKSFFVEAGAGFSYYHGLDSFGLIRPRLSVGWIF